MPEFWMCLMLYIAKATVQITEQLSRKRGIQNTAKHLRWSVLQKECMSPGAQPEIFPGRRGFM